MENIVNYILCGRGIDPLVSSLDLFWEIFKKIVS
jgi:hypothetical protein